MPRNTPGITSQHDRLEPYRGRFAPSPTGPLHFGSLIAAVASYLEAQRAGGAWILRIEDIDPPRQAPDAADRIVRSLDRHGFCWTGPVSYQSERVSEFQAVVDELLDRGLAYACECSRQQIRLDTRPGPLGPVYPGTCRDRGLAPTPGSTAVRLRTGHDIVRFRDRLQGQLVADVAADIGDFVLRRRDGLIAYALAVVLDDHAQRITDVVRGTDLLEFTPAQIWLQRHLNLPMCRYMHVPLAVDGAGRKLSKQTGAAAIDDARPAANLVDCLTFLRQQPPAELAGAGAAEVWQWATENWRPGALEGIRSLTFTPHEHS